MNILYQNKSYLPEHFSFKQAKKDNPELTKKDYLKILDSNGYELLTNPKSKKEAIRKKKGTLENKNK